MRRLLSLVVLFALAGIAFAAAQQARPPASSQPRSASPEPRVPSPQPQATKPSSPGSPVPNPDSRIRIAYLFSDGNMSGTLKAYKELLQERPDLRGRIAMTFLTESVLADV